MQKNLKIILIIIIVSLLILFAYCAIKKYYAIQNIINSDIISIIYSEQGGYGTKQQIATKKVEITNEGYVIYTNNYNEIFTEKFSIDISKFKTLNNYVVENIEIFTTNLKEERYVSDGGSSYITIKLADGRDFTIGGYMITNKSFSKLVDKILEITDKNRFNSYSKAVSELP